MWTALPGSVSPLGCAGCSCDKWPSQCVVSEVTEEASGLQLQFHWFLSQFLVAVVVLAWSKGPAAVKVSAAPVPPRPISCVGRATREGGSLLRT